MATITVTEKTKTELETLAKAASMSTEDYLEMLIDLATNKPATPPMTGDEFLQYLDDLDQHS